MGYPDFAGGATATIDFEKMEMYCIEELKKIIGLYIKQEMKQIIRKPLFFLKKMHTVC